jgi:hypothetical protein
MSQSGQTCSGMGSAAAVVIATVLSNRRHSAKLSLRHRLASHVALLQRPVSRVARIEQHLAVTQGLIWVGWR